MVRKTFLIYKNSRGFLFVGLLALIGFMAYRIPPASTPVILAFILLTSVFVTTLFSFFLRIRDGLFIGVTIGIILALNAYFGPNLLNSLLLISFVLGLRFLVQ